jgi:hypothetical protein
MKKFFYALAFLIGFSTLPLQSEGILDIFGTYSSYAFYYTDHTQSGIGPNDIVEISHIGSHNNPKFGLSARGF